MSTNKFFEHQVIPQNSATSPVENLASEVSLGFDNVGKLLSSDTVYPSLTRVIGNFILNDLSYHGFSQTRSDTFSISESTKDLSLSFIPTSNIAISYIDTATGSEVFLTQKQPTQELTSTTDFKVLGRVVILAGSFVGQTLKASYTGLEPTFGNKKVKPNVIKNTDGAYLVPLVEITDTDYSLTYNVNLQAMYDKYFNMPLDTDKIYVIAKENDDYIILEHDSISLNGNVATVVFDNGLEKAYQEVLLYVLNVTIADLLESIYVELTTHTHGKDSVTKPINHKDILNNYQNSSKIYYKDSEVPNYNHPQFLNREGYNPSISSAYENAMLGDFFLGALISDNDQTFKTLTKDSVRILFGDPVAGSKLYFDNKLKALNFLTGASLNGINVTIGNGFKAFSINNNTYITEFTNDTQIKGKNNKVTFVSDGTDKATVESENIISTNIATFKQAIADILIIGNTKISTDGVDTTYSSINPDLKSKVIYEAPTVYKDVTIENGTIVEATLKDKLKTNEDNYLQNDDDNFNFNLKDKVVAITQKSGKTSGLTLGTSSKKLKIFGSDYLGQIGTNIDTSFYVETPKDSETYFLKSTDEAITINGKSYVFQKDVAGAIRIDSLKDWYRSTVHFGIATADKLSLKGSDETDRNGLVINETRISVIGEGLDCPEGVTIFESANDVNFIKFLGKDNVDCKSISYQSVNMGSLQVFGEAAIEGSLSVVGNVTASETVTSDTLVVNTIANIRDLSVAGETTFSGPANFIGVVDISNNMSVTGAIDLTGSLSASDGNFEKFVNVGDTLTVGGQAIFSDNLIVQGSITSTKDFITNGTITAGDIKAGDARFGAIIAQGAITAVGGLTAEGPAEFKGNVTANGNIKTEGNVNAAGDITASSLYITDDTTLMGRFTSDGPVTMSTTSFTVGSADATLMMYGNLQVSGLKSVFSGSVNIQGEATISSSLRVSENITCTGEINAVSLKTGANVSVGGTLTADAAEFVRKVFFTDGLKTSGSSEFTIISSDSLTTKSLNADAVYIKDTLSMGPDAKVEAYTVEVSQFIQKDPSSQATFAGEVVFNNLAKFNEKIIVGNADIEFKRSTSGCLITDNQIKLGNNSTIEAIKFFAAKGSPVAGNRDLNAGYCFASSYIDSGVDGDTGLFATQGQDVGLDGSDLEIWIDGVRKYIFPKYDVSYTNKEAKNSTVAVTLDMLQKMQADLEAKITASLTSTTSAAWPIGCIYITANDSNPYTVFKFGTWVRFAAGRTLVGKVTGDINEQGGTISQGLTSPSDWTMSQTGATYGDFKHSLTGAQNGPHVHSLKDYAYPENSPSLGGAANAPRDPNPWSGLGSGRTDWDNDSIAYHIHDTFSSGNGEPHNNVQPSIIVNMWQRIA